MKTAFIGLGIMGSRMAANLIKAGFDITVYNRTYEKAETISKLGCQYAKTASEAVNGADVIITMLSTREAVKETALGQYGFLRYAKKNALWIDSSTVDPDFSIEMSVLAESMGIRFIDAPVAGSKMPAETAGLIFLCGGKSEDIEQARPLFEKMGKQIISAGGIGKGSALKIIVNMIMGSALEALCEGLHLGEAFGFDKAELFDNLMQLPVTAPVFKGKRDKFINEEYSAEFPLQWMHKDLFLASEAAYKLNTALPGLNLSKELFAKARQDGFGKEDITALYKVISNK